MSFTTTALLLTWVALVLLALVVAGLVRQVHQLTRGPGEQETGLRTGMPAPTLEHLAPEPDAPTLVLFLSDECPACRDVFQESLELTGAPPIRAVFTGAALDGVAPANMRVLTDQDDLFTAYRVPATPYAVLVGVDGRVRTAEPVGSVRALHALIVEAGGRVPGDTEPAGLLTGPLGDLDVSAAGEERPSDTGARVPEDAARGGSTR